MNLRLIFKSLSIFLYAEHFHFFTTVCAIEIVIGLHDNLIYCLHLMILQDINTNRSMKISNRYLKSVTEVGGGQDGSQTSFGEIFFFPLPL